MLHNKSRKMRLKGVTRDMLDHITRAHLLSGLVAYALCQPYDNRDECDHNYSTPVTYDFRSGRNWSSVGIEGEQALDNLLMEVKLDWFDLNKATHGNDYIALTMNIRVFELESEREVMRVSYEIPLNSTSPACKHLLSMVKNSYDMPLTIGMDIYRKIYLESITPQEIICTAPAQFTAQRIDALHALLAREIPRTIENATRSG